MVAENTTKNANFIRIVMMLRNLRDNGSITEREYLRAKKYYLKLTEPENIKERMKRISERRSIT